MAHAADSGAHAARMPRASATARVFGGLLGVPAAGALVPQLADGFIRDEFEVPKSEEALYDAACALKEHHMLLQGRLFVFQQRVCFFSNLFGVVHKKMLLFADITSIKRASVRHVFSAVEIVCNGHVYIFASVWDRDRALAALQDAWVASGSRYAELWLETQTHAVGAPRAEDVLAVPQRGSGGASASSDEERSDEEPVTPQEARTQPRAAADDEGTSPEPEPVTPTTESSAHLDDLLEAASQSPEPLLSPPAPLIPAAAAASPSARPAACAGAQPAPPPDGGVKLPVAPDGGEEALLDCTPSEFFALFLSNESRFVEAFRSARGETNIEVEPWSDSGECSTRTITFRAPLDAMKGSVRLPGIPKNTRIKEEQRCFFHACAEGDPQLIVLESTSAQLDIPYGDSFVLDVRIELRSASATPPRCAACVYFRVRWLHTPRIAMIRKKIESQSRDATAESYRAMLEMAQRYLARWEAAAAADAARGKARAPPPAAGEEMLAAAPPAAAAPVGVVPLARLEAVLSQLEPEEASHIRQALHIGPPSRPVAVKGVPGVEGLLPEERLVAEDETTHTPAKEPSLRHQSLISSGQVTFGAVYDALQMAAQTLAPAPMVKQTWRKRLAGWLTLAWLTLASLVLLAVLLLLGVAMYRAGVRHGERMAALVTSSPADGGGNLLSFVPMPSGGPVCAA